MTLIEVALGERSYEILIKDGLLDDAGAHLAPLARDNRLLVVSDETVWAAQGPRLMRGLGAIEARSMPKAVHAVEAARQAASKFPKWLQTSIP